VVAYQRGGDAPAAGFRIPKFGHIYACRATTSGHMVKRMARGDSAHRISLVCDPQGLSNCSGGILNGGNAPVAGFRVPNFGHIHAFRATTSRRMVKVMVRGHLARQIAPVRDFQGLSNYSGGISNVDINPVAGF
jgi:hypothetical protein